MLDRVVGRVGRRLWGVIGLSSLAMGGCVREPIDDGEGDDGGMMSASGPMTGGPMTSPEPGSGSGSSASGSESGVPPATTSDSDSDSGSTGWTNDCGDDVERTVCVDPEGGSSGGSDSSSGESGAVDDTGGSGDTGGLCDGVVVTDYSFCVYGTGEVFEQDGQCCAVLTGTEHCCDGRPFFVEGHARTAACRPGGEWAAELAPAIDDLSPAERDALAQAWSEDGLMEHASVASFARFALQLMAIGAPPDLLVDTQQAIRDEVEHARLCFGLASAYAGQPIGPGPLAVDGALAGQTDLVAAVVATVREGCIGETIAAVHAELAAARATDPAVRAVLEQIAEDEARHAELAWRFVAWALAEGGAEVRRAVAEAFAGDVPALPDRPPPMDVARWHAHGRLTETEHADVVVRTCRRIIQPLAAQLIAPREPTAGRRVAAG